MSLYQHNWPEFEFGWRLVVGSTIGFLGAAMGSIGGIGGGAIFVPMLFLIIGFDPKSSAAVSKCMIMGTAAATVYYNSRLSHPTFSNTPLIDYDLALLFQPLLMVGISVGVALNIILADWMITILLIFLFLVNATRSFIKGVEIWKKETAGKQGTTKQQESDGSTFIGQISEELPLTKVMEQGMKERKVKDFAETENDTAHFLKIEADDVNGYRSVHRVPEASMRLKQLVLLVFVWAAFFAVQIMKTHVMACSIDYWILNLVEVIIGFSVSIYQAVCLYKGRRAITSCSNETTDWTLSKVLLFFFTGIVAGVIGGMLGIGGGTILTPLFLELGIHPQVASATSAFAMLFSSSMSVVQYYILKRFPVPYAVYLYCVAVIAAFTGQDVVRRIISVIGRTSIIIFILAFTIAVSTICLGGAGIIHMILKVQNHEYMGFQSLCNG
ncbi:sulfite exporter TauE/SafE family protein 3-like [Amaranthus tricolor]|uniref:sulfite exporter TauE/SafE family protein 3-like n=1 Tax=Amaranthus tricolor TaxID=29722 RepID=UPI00258E2346|nr:sulfite exporter TauE/SafE family protein 3-like [Amaranthus tricolor]